MPKGSREHKLGLWGIQDELDRRMSRMCQPILHVLMIYLYLNLNRLIEICPADTLTISFYLQWIDLIHDAVDDFPSALTRRV